MAAYEKLRRRQHQPAQAIAELLNPARPAVELERTGRFSRRGMEEDGHSARER